MMRLITMVPACRPDSATAPPGGSASGPAGTVSSSALSLSGADVPTRLRDAEDDPSRPAEGLVAVLRCARALVTIRSGPVR